MDRVILLKFQFSAWTFFHHQSESSGDALVVEQRKWTNFLKSLGCQYDVIAGEEKNPKGYEF